jgi:hypothetical protein
VYTGAVCTSDSGYASLRALLPFDNLARFAVRRYTAFSRAHKPLPIRSRFPSPEILLIDLGDLWSRPPGFRPGTAPFFSWM